VTACRQHRFDRLAQPAMPPQVSSAHVGVGVDAGLISKAIPLHRPRVFDPGPDGGAGLAGLLAHDVAVGHRGNLEVDVDPVEQRS